MDSFSVSSWYHYLFVTEEAETNLWHVLGVGKATLLTKTTEVQWKLSMWGCSQPRPLCPIPDNRRRRLEQYRKHKRHRNLKYVKWKRLLRGKIN